MRLLFVGDVVGGVGRRTLAALLPGLRERHEPDFVVVNGDIFTDYDFARLCDIEVASAHLVLVDNPEHHAEGDFAWCEGRLVPDREGVPRLTYSGIAVLHPRLFADSPEQLVRLHTLEHLARARLTVIERPMHFIWYGSHESLRYATAVTPPPKDAALKQHLRDTGAMILDWKGIGRPSVEVTADYWGAYEHDGIAIDEIGLYHPIETEDKQIRIDEAKAKFWLARGAQPSDTVRSLLNKKSIQVK